MQRNAKDSESTMSRRSRNVRSRCEKISGRGRRRRASEHENTSKLNTVFNFTVTRREINENRPARAMIEIAIAGNSFA